MNCTKLNVYGIVLPNLQLATQHTLVQMSEWVVLHLAQHIAGLSRHWRVLII